MSYPRFEVALFNHFIYQKVRNIITFKKSSTKQRKNRTSKMGLISKNMGAIPYNHNGEAFFHCLFSSPKTPCINLCVSLSPTPN